MKIPSDPITGQPLVTTAMKAACIGEFRFQRVMTCGDCASGEPAPDCEVCGGEVEYLESIEVPWTTCKEIYKSMARAAAE